MGKENEPEKSDDMATENDAALNALILAVAKDVSETAIDIIETSFAALTVTEHCSTPDEQSP